MEPTASRTSHSARVRAVWAFANTGVIAKAATNSFVYERHETSQNDLWLGNMISVFANHYSDAHHALRHLTISLLTVVLGKGVVCFSAPKWRAEQEVGNELSK